MKIRTSSRTTIPAAALALLLSTAGTPALAAPDLVNPAELKLPAQVSCIHLPAALSGIDTRGLFKVEWETRLERGPYIAEYEDAEGTYFRAPPGGVYQGPPKGKPAKGAWQIDLDGGIFVPRDPSAPPQLYSYVGDTGKSAATLVPAAAADCSNTSYLRDPATKAIRVSGYAGDGAKQTDARQVGLAGGGVAGYYLNEFVEGPNRGKIMKLPQSRNPEFSARLKELVGSAVPIKAADTPD